MNTELPPFKNEEHNSESVCPQVAYSHDQV